jgi:hypothetical protein
MTTPYRKASVAEGGEPVPYLGVDERVWPGLLRHTVLVLAAALAVAAYDEREALKLLIIFGPGIVVVAILAVLREPVGRWLAARRARAVIEGVAALEAKVSARE